MGFFERYKALIITSLLFSITVLALVTIHLHTDRKELAATLIDLNNYDLLQEEEEEQEPAEEQEPGQVPDSRQVATHQAYNQDQEEAQDLDARLQEIFEKNAAESMEAESEESNASSGEFSVSKNVKEEKSSRSDGDNTSESTSERSGTMKNSSIS